MDQEGRCDIRKGKEQPESSSRRVPGGCRMFAKVKTCRYICAIFANVKNSRGIRQRSRGDIVPRISPSEIASVSIAKGDLRLGQRINSWIDIQYPLFVLDYINWTRTSFWSILSHVEALVRRCTVHESCSSFIFHPRSQLCRHLSCPLSTREEPLWRIDWNPAGTSG